jgi:hypothetical protein
MPRSRKKPGMARWLSQESSNPHDLCKYKVLASWMSFSGLAWWTPNHAQCPRKDLFALLPQYSGSSRKARLTSRLGDRDHRITSLGLHLIQPLFLVLSLKSLDPKLKKCVDFGAQVTFVCICVMPSLKGVEWGRAVPFYRGELKN